LSRAFSATLRAVLFLAIPAAVGLLVWRVPLIRMLLERGAFGPESTALTATALAFYSLGLIGHSAVEILARAFYALHDTRTPVVVGVAAMAGNVLLSLLLRGPLSHAGLALANTIATTVEMVVLLWLLARRWRGLEWTGLGVSAAKAVVAALAMAAVLWWLRGQIGVTDPILTGIGGLALGGAVYVGVASLLRAPELASLQRLLPSRR
jgi:putative peptidoglycan lipid II flippase